MRFHVVPLSKEQSGQKPPISKMLLEQTRPALLFSARKPSIILFCDAIAGEFPGFDKDQQVYLLNDAARAACGGLGLVATKTIDDAEIPEKYGLLVGPASALYPDRRFE